MPTGWNVKVKDYEKNNKTCMAYVSNFANKYADACGLQ